MALSSSSTDAQVQAALDDNAGYDDAGSVSAAKAYRTALRTMIGRLARAAEVSDNGSSLKVQIAGLQSEMVSVQTWLNATDSDAADAGGQDPINFDFSDFRG